MEEQRVNPSALPSGPLDEIAVAAVTFTLPIFPDADVSIPLSVQLQPGTYGIIFGSGLFGATGVGSMPMDNIDLPGASYFVFNSQGHGWTDDSFSKTRFVVYGEVVPEPSTCLLLMTALLGLAVTRRRAGVSA